MRDSGQVGSHPEGAAAAGYRGGVVRSETASGFSARAPDPVVPRTLVTRAAPFPTGAAGMQPPVADPPTGGCRSERRRSRGFSLLEVLVAFTIMALTLGVLMQVFSGSINGTRNSEEYQEAAALAESVLALVGADIPLEPGSQGGELNGFVWRTEISESPATELVAPPEDLIPHLVRVRVEWASGGRTRDLELITLRLGQPPS